MISIREEVSRMEHIIRQLLDFSRRSPLRCSETDPAQLMASAVASVQQEAGDAGTRIEAAGPEDSHLIELDPIRVQQALTNLLRNAIQCSPGGHVRCSWRHPEKAVLFCVDDGAGLRSQSAAFIIS